MSRSLAEAKVTTRNARTGLAAGTHWRSIDPDIHLGYRKGIRGGRWLVRWYSGDQKYRQATIGTADDAVGPGNLSYDEAVKSARLTVGDARLADKAAAEGPAPTVGMVVAHYISLKDAHVRSQTGRQVRSDSSHRLGLHVLKNDAFVAIELHKLTEADIRSWRSGLDQTLKATSVQRLVNDLKAALNAAYQDRRKLLPADFPEIVRSALKVKPGNMSDEPVARDNQILTDDQVRQIIEAAFVQDEDGDLARLVAVLAATGARFSQIRRMQIRDVQAAQSRLLVPTSRKGRARVAGYTPIQVGQDVIDSLLPAIKGRLPTDTLFLRWRHIQRRPGLWVRDERGPWRTPSEMIRPWHAICIGAGLAGTVPYALRHSSIVRGIRHGLPIRLVAALHDTSVVMIERHYSRWITDGLEELAAKAVIPLMPVAEARSHSGEGSRGVTVG